MVLSSAHVWPLAVLVLLIVSSQGVTLWLPDALLHTSTHTLTSLFISAHCCRDGMEDISGRFWMCVCVYVCV